MGLHNFKWRIQTNLPPSCLSQKIYLSMRLKDSLGTGDGSSVAVEPLQKIFEIVPTQTLSAACGGCTFKRYGMVKMLS